MVASCCRFLCYFCRISRQNQKAMFDHLSYLLENSSVGLGRQQRPWGGGLLKVFFPRCNLKCVTEQPELSPLMQREAWQRAGGVL